jgi:hypothetical protein
MCNDEKNKSYYSILLFRHSTENGSITHVYSYKFNPFDNDMHILLFRLYCSNIFHTFTPSLFQNTGLLRRFLKVYTAGDVSHQLWGTKHAWTTHVWKFLDYLYQNFDSAYWSRERSFRWYSV